MDKPNLFHFLSSSFFIVLAESIEIHPSMEIRLTVLQPRPRPEPAHRFPQTHNPCQEEPR